MPKTYINNRYYQVNPNNFIKLRNLIIKYPRQCTRMLLAKNRVQGLEYLYNWINSIVKQFFIEFPPTLIEKLVWIMNDMIDYPKCQNLNCTNKVRKYQSIGKYGSHCCSKCAGENSQTLIKREETCFKKFGAKNVFASRYGKNKIKETCIQKYGVPYSGMSEIKKIHTEESNLKKYGVKHVNQVPEIKQKGTDTLITNYGQLFNYSKYLYDKQKFDSSWEIIYYIYLKSNNIQFEFHKKHFWLSYFKNGKECRYYPDFIVNNEIHEIKGDQFFNKNNEPYDRIHNVWWHEKYKCMIKNNVKIIRGNDMIPILKWFNENYPINYLDQFLIHKTRQYRKKS